MEWEAEFTDEFGNWRKTSPKTLMPTRKFQKSLNEMPAARRKRIAKRVEQTLAAMPLEELRRARRMTQPLAVPTPGVMGPRMLMYKGPACEHTSKPKAASVALY